MTSLPDDVMTSFRFCKACAMVFAVEWGPNSGV